jgi:hypothetical protein
MSRTLYRSLSQLEVWQQYTIGQCSEKGDGNILLYLRGSKEEGEFVPSSTTAYRTEGISRGKTTRGNKWRLCEINFTYYWVYTLRLAACQDLWQRVYAIVRVNKRNPLPETLIVNKTIQFILLFTRSHMYKTTVFKCIKGVISDLSFHWVQHF